MDQFITREAFSLMTEAQRIAFASLLSRDLDVITPFYITGNKSDNYLFGQVRFNQTGLTIWFGIEPDGYTHT